jgi:DNA modification methylase
VNGCTLHCADSLDPTVGLRTLPEKSVASIITDPPYSEHVHRAHRIGATNVEGRPAAIYRNRDLEFEHITPEQRRAAAVEFARLARRWVLVFTDYEGVGDWIAALEGAGLEHVRVGHWRKLGSTPQFTGDRPAEGCEAIVIAHQPPDVAGRKVWNGGGRAAFWEVPIVLNRGGKVPRLHTTQKPLQLMEMLLRDFTDAGDVVLDPFAGSGTTGVACRRLGRQFIGFERLEKWWRVAARRLEHAHEQTEMAFG